MGVIRRQGSKQFVVHLFGVAIGALSTLFIYPHSTEMYGFARFMLDTALFLSPFVLLGVGHLPVKFFPRFRDLDSNHGGYLGALLILAALSSLIFLASVFMFRDHFFDFFDSKHPFFNRFGHFLVPLALLTAFTAIFSRYISNFKLITVPYIFTNLLQKVFLPVLILLSFYNYLTADQFIWALTGGLILSLLALIGYLNYLNELKIGRINTEVLRKNIKEMLVFAGYGMLGGVGSALATRIDSIMVASLVDFSNNGAYNIGSFISNVVSAPLIAVSTIAGPIISSAWTKKDYQEINNIFRDASSVLLVVGLGIFLLIIASIQDLIKFFPDRPEFSGLYGVVFFIGLAKIFDLLASVNNEVILYSKFFRFNLIAIFLLGIFNVVGNYYFIAVLDYGMVGAAIGTAVSLFLYNAIKLLFIFVKMKMVPFTIETLFVMLLGGAVYALTSYFSFNYSILVNILIKSVFILLTYFGVVYYFRLSKQFNEGVQSLIQRIIYNKK